MSVPSPVLHHYTETPMIKTSRLSAAMVAL
jgi:hypothetical protein